MSQVPAMKRRHAVVDEIELEGSWAISYGDMLTLLLAFFILFFSINPKEQRQAAIHSELLKTLAPLTISRPFPETNPSFEDLKKLDQEMSRRWNAKIRQVSGKIVVEFPGVSFFDKGKTDTNGDGQRVLADFAKLYVPFAGTHTLTIIGFADSQPVKRRRRYTDNLELSVLRSVSALRVLQNAGVPLNGIRLGGHGSSAGAPELQVIRGDHADLDKFKLARRVVLIVEPEGGA